MELAAPAGLVRSRAVTSVDGEVRLALNVPLLARRTTRTRRACSTSRCRATTSSRPRGRCGPTASAPARSRATTTTIWPPATTSNADLLEALRELDVLYERSGGGEFLHFYTPTVDGRLFFELVERRGGYAGYGAANAPVRMAAQRAASLDGDRRHDSQVNTRERDHGEQRAVG